MKQDRVEVLEEFVAEFSERANNLYRESWKSRKEWSGKLFEAFEALPPERRMKWVELVHDLALQAKSLCPQPSDAGGANDQFGRAYEAYCTIANSKRAAPGGMSGGVKGWEVDFRGSSHYRALKDYAPDWTHEELEREVIKLATKSGRLSTPGRRLVADLIATAPDSCDTNAALSTWFLTEMGIRISPESLRQIQKDPP